MDRDSGESSHRRCIASGEHAERDRMIRFVVSPDGELVPDVAAKLPGRGIWLSPGRDRIITAATRGLFARAARRSVRLPTVGGAGVSPEQLADLIERLMVRRCEDGLGLARRAGQAVAGFEKVRAALARPGAVGLLLTACDASANARAKIEGLRRRAETPPAEAHSLRAAEIGAGFARDHVVHAAIAPGRLAERLAVDLDRLGALRSEGRPA